MSEALDVTSEQWPPDYRAVFAERLRRMNMIAGDPEMQRGLRAFYKTHPVEFVEDWGITYDPRNAMEVGLPTLLPFHMFERQRDFVRWIVGQVERQEDGLCEKTRDMGATWVAVAVSVWYWIFYDGAAIGWGSMSKTDVDDLGNPASVFEKIRMYVAHLPGFLRPRGLKASVHMTSMRCVNPVNGSTITGDVGDKIGRSGRTLMYFKDEAAHYERAEKIEASLGDNTNVQIDISSVNGEGNVFHKRRQSLGDANIFILDWRHHPLKTQEWYAVRKAKYIGMGLEHVFAQEVDRDYSSAVQGVCIPALWVKAAVGLQLDGSGMIRAGLDVATEDGSDANALTIRRGSTVLQLAKHERTWHGLDGSETAYKADEIVLAYGGVPGETTVGYDGHGVGASIQAPAKHTQNIFYPVFVGSTSLPGLYTPIEALDAGPTTNEEGRAVREVKRIKNKDFFRNKKAKLWWEARLRFYRTYQYVNGLADYHHDDLVSLPVDSDGLQMQLSQPRMFRNDAGKRQLETKDQLGARGIDSPDEAESFILSYDNGYSAAAPSLRSLN